MADKMLGFHKNGLASVTLVPAQGGAFEVFVDGKQVYSKLKTGEFPDEMLLTNKLITARLT